MDLSDRFNRHSAGSKASGLAYYNTDAPVRTVHFIPLGGAKLFLNYSDLVSGELLPEENTITLTFQRHVVTLRGRHLEALFDSLAAHGVRLITAVEERYAETTEEAEPLVTQIDVQAV